MLKNIIGRNRYVPVLSFLLISAAISPVRAQQGLPIPLDPKVRRGVLPNGFTYYIRHNEMPKGRVVFNLVVKAGSILEDDDQSGLAHFMEHMSFNGTKHFPKNELVDYLQKNGLRFGADINAYTGFDETVYQLPLTNTIGTLKKGLLIIRDWAQEATLDSEEINKERGIILEEKRTQSGAAQRMQSKYTPMLFNYSRYADREPIGTDSNLRNFSPAALKRFYHDWYRPDLQAIIAVGDFDVDLMEQLIKSSFSTLTNPLHKRERVKYAIGLDGKDGFMAVKDPEMTTAVAQIIIKHQAPEMKTVADYKLAVTSRLFNTVVARRLKALVANDSAQVLQANASISELMGGLDNLSINIVTEPAKLQQGTGAVWTEIERIRQVGFESRELALAKQFYANAMENGLREKNSITSDSYVQEYVAHFLHGNLAPGMDTEYQLVSKFLAEITVEDLNSLAKAYIRSDNRNIILMGPENSVLPTEGIFKSWLISSQFKGNINGLAGKVMAQKPLLKAEPVAGKVTSVSSDKNGITRMLLSNGISVVLKPTTFKNDEVLFSGFSAGGTSLYSGADYQSAKNAAAIVSASGVGNYSHKELEDYLSGKQMGVQPFISELSQGVAGGSTAGNIGAALQLAYAYLTEPVVDRSLFNQLISRSKISLAGRDKNPERIFQDSITAILGNHQLRRMPVNAEKINAINLDRAYQIYKQRFADNTGMTFTFVGSFKIDSIRPLLEKYLGALPASGKSGSFKDTGIGLPAANIKRIIKKGVASKASVELFYIGNFDYSEKERLKLDALKGILQLRLTERLREQESGIYTPSVALSMDKIPQKEFRLSIAFECAPENTERLIKATLDEINKLREKGPSAAALQKYQIESVRSREISVTSNQWWLGYLASQLENKDPLDSYRSYVKDLGRLNAAELKSAAVKYLNEEKLSQFVLLPE